MGRPLETAGPPRVQEGIETVSAFECGSVLGIGSINRRSNPTDRIWWVGGGVPETLLVSETHGF